MLDVHPPHEPTHSWWDFFVHLFTITVGLLIALSLEGCVEWRHHRHLVYEAEASLREEIKANSEQHIAGAIDSLHKQQETLKHDISVLNYIIDNKKAPKDSTITLSFSMHNLSSVSWKTAQTTTALSYMPYKRAQEYADIYTTQEKFNLAEEQAARDAIIALAPFANGRNDTADPTGGQAVEARNSIEILQGQLLLVDALIKELDRDYKQFLTAHPE